MVISFQYGDIWGALTEGWRWLLAVASPDGGVGSRESRFEHAVRQYGPMIERICFGYAQTRTEMQDLYQDVMLNIWQALPGFRGDASLKTWIYRIALNTCVSTIRKVPSGHSRVDIEALCETTESSGEHIELLRELHEVISGLNAIDKAVVMMWLDEMSYDEIADTMGLPRNTVATKLRRAKLTIKEKFTK